MIDDGGAMDNNVMDFSKVFDNIPHSQLMQKI